MKAEIITIGDEILIGQIVDTNSAWIAEQFNIHGIEIFQITSVHDDREHILEALKNAAEKVDLVVITGGLGPTKDDITKKTLCEFFQTELVLHEPTLEHIKNRFVKRNIDINKLNRDQALVPVNAVVLFNLLGTAPGMWFEKDKTIFVSLPGVPFEMKYLIENEVLPRLAQTGKTKAIYHKTILTQGIPESMLAIRIEDFENNLPSGVKLAYLPSPMGVRLRLSVSGNNKEELRNIVEQEVEKLNRIIPEAIYGYDDETMAEAIGKLLLSEGKTLGVAESCTGGFISHLITSVPGCSAWYKGSVTAYSNQVKAKVLGVQNETLEKYGAVSEQTALEMVTGVKNAFNTDFAVATTGIAGPVGGTEEKPVGTVWIAVATSRAVIAQKFVFGDNRERNIIRSGQAALQFLRKKIIEEIQA